MDQISSLKYAPVSSCDVEGSFSMFVIGLSDKRMSLNEDNLEKLAVVHFRTIKTKRQHNVELNFNTSYFFFLLFFCFIVHVQSYDSV